MRARTSGATILADYGINSLFFFVTVVAASRSMPTSSFGSFAEVLISAQLLGATGRCIGSEVLAVQPQPSRLESVRPLLGKAWLLLFLLGGLGGLTVGDSPWIFVTGALVVVAGAEVCRSALHVLDKSVWALLGSALSLGVFCSGVFLTEPATTPAFLLLLAVAAAMQLVAAVPLVLAGLDAGGGSRANVRGAGRLGALFAGEFWLSTGTGQLVVVLFGEVLQSPDPAAGLRGAAALVGPMTTLASAVALAGPAWLVEDALFQHKAPNHALRVARVCASIGIAYGCLLVFSGPVYRSELGDASDVILIALPLLWLTRFVDLLALGPQVVVRAQVRPGASLAVRGCGAFATVAAAIVMPFDSPVRRVALGLLVGAVVSLIGWLSVMYFRRDGASVLSTSSTLRTDEA